MVSVYIAIDRFVCWLQCYFQIQAQWFVAERTEQAKGETVLS
jgi:hypothetical protein